MGRAPCCEKIGLKRGPWTPEEDQKLVTYINENGHGSWRALPKKAGLLRCGKSCRLRWTNYLRPDIKRGEFTLTEEQTIIQLHALLGNRWSAIASHLPKRTDNEIKNYWNTHLKKKLVKMGLDPTTHKPTVENTLMGNNADPTTDHGNSMMDLLLKTANSPNGSSITSHMAQWESARLEAESRLAQEAQLRAKGLWRGGSGASNPVSAAPLTSLTPLSATDLNGITNSSSVCADALKALNAVELMHALHNWEKSLQGQAGMMWPEVWQLPDVRLPLREAQAESSSCSSHCSDVNTNTSPLGTMGPRRSDHWSPTSTLCSLDSHNIKQKGLQSSLVSAAHSGVHSRKLSWSDALGPLAPKLEMPVSAPLSNVSTGFGMQGVSCKMEEGSNTFSSLMQDAVFDTDTSVSAYESMYAKIFVTDEGMCNNVVEEGTRGKVDLTQDEDGDDTAVEVMHSATYEGVSRGKESCSDDTKGGVVDNASSVLLPSEINTEQDVKESAVDRTDANSEDNSKNDDVLEGEMDSKEDMKEIALDRNSPDGDDVLPGEMDLEEAAKEGVPDHNNPTSDDNKNDDVDEGKSICSGGEIIGTEMFTDLPKLKSNASTPRLTSYCALLSEEIPDYWSSIIMKEPTLQQVDLTF